MNITAMLRRASLLAGVATLASVLVACAGSQTVEPVDSELMASNEVGLDQAVEFADSDIGNEMPAAEANAPVIESRKVFSDVADQPIGIELVRGSEFDQIVIRTEEASPDYRVSRLSGPERIVIDVLGTKTGANRKFQVESDEFVSGIRLGAHPDKSRIVLDVNTQQDLVHNVDTTSGDIVVTLANPGQMDRVLAGLSGAPVPQLPTEETMVADASIMEAPESAENIEQPLVEEPQQDAVVSEDADVSAEVVPVSAQIEPNEITSTPQLTRLEMEAVAGEGNVLMAHMESAGYFSIQQTAPSEYVLRLEGANFEPEKIQTILAGPEAGSIRSARAVREGNDTLVRIFVQTGTTLKAEAKRGMILVKESSDSGFGALPDEARAQLTPEEEAGEADAAAEEVLDEEGDAAIASLLDDAPRFTGRLISLDLQDTDIDNALRIIAEVSNLNIIASDDVTGKVTLRLIDVPWDQALDVILKTNGLDKVQEGSVVRIAPVEKLRLEREALRQAREAEEELEPLEVKYIRISYARASELKELVDTVISERGTVTYDERTNQLIVKDIRRGVKNVAQLVNKLDLRTPQVLLETQIVEAKRELLRDLGAEMQFDTNQGPETGNATGYNFPNAIIAAAGAAFPAAISPDEGSAVSILLDSADGSLGLDVTLTALENDGRVRIVSRPAVATTNNQTAIIKSVEKIRVKTPDGGLSVATGSGASAAGSGGVATETIEIGIILEVTPQASPDYYVLLDVHAKSSTLGAVIVDGIPSEIERSATSTVLVSSGQTFALGGIYKITDQNRLNGVPFLKDIPFLGHLFRRSQVDNSDEELIFFVTPRIIEGSFDDAAMRVAS